MFLIPSSRLTSNIQGMFQDVDWSRETMSVYKQAMKDLGPSGEVDASCRC